MLEKTVISRVGDHSPLQVRDESSYELMPVEETSDSCSRNRRGHSGIKKSRLDFLVRSPVNHSVAMWLIAASVEEGSETLAAGLEPSTFGLGNRCSIQLSYASGVVNGSENRSSPEKSGRRRRG